jgi:hypothetical protein
VLNAIAAVPTIPTQRTPTTSAPSATPLWLRAAATVTPTATASVSNTYFSVDFSVDYNDICHRQQAAPTAGRARTAVASALVGAAECHCCCYADNAAANANNKCGRCDIPVSQGGCRCDSNCDCIREQHLFLDFLSAVFLHQASLLWGRAALGGGSGGPYICCTFAPQHNSGLRLSASTRGVEYNCAACRRRRTSSLQQQVCQVRHRCRSRRLQMQLQLRLYW